MVASLQNQNARLDGKRKKVLKDYYEVAAKLEYAEGIIVKLTVQVNYFLNYNTARTDFYRKLTFSRLLIIISFTISKQFKILKNQIQDFSIFSN